MNEAAFGTAIDAGDFSAAPIYLDWLQERMGMEPAVEQVLGELLTRIIAKPKDDGLRLAYADVCELGGRMERAEFIRVQYELEICPQVVSEDIATAAERLAGTGLGALYREAEGSKYLPPAFQIHRPNPRIKELQIRERELLKKNVGAWTEFLPESLTTTQCPDCIDGSPDYETNVVECRQCDSTGTVFTDDNFEFHRGFVSSITCTLTAWCATICQGCYASNDHGEAGHGNWRMRDCPRCDGEGKTGGYGSRIVRAAPIERLVVTDRTPNDRHVWFANQDRDDAPGAIDGNWLPWSVARHFQIGGMVYAYDVFIRHVWAFANQALAFVALSDAMLRHARA